MTKVLADQLATALREASRSLRIATAYNGTLTLGNPGALTACFPMIDAALAAYDQASIGSESPKDRKGEMSLKAALDFADYPRPQATLVAPADTMDELRRALAVLAAAYRLGQPVSPGLNQQLREWFNLAIHAGIDAREENAPSTLHRIQDIARQLSAAISATDAPREQTATASAVTTPLAIGQQA